ncbi:Retinal dehydrogenase 1 [Eumeta japonica]|uniref:Retinal dehydrogenase 1 n=1 Tax=Eumeta variegata TaxID=151549 RepID=A0A4C1UBV8_EUMVA|nr:Retinal dehydrogenase 1 [Eumeta japonica]
MSKLTTKHLNDVQRPRVSLTGYDSAASIRQTGCTRAGSNDTSRWPRPPTRRPAGLARNTTKELFYLSHAKVMNDKDSAVEIVLQGVVLCPQYLFIDNEWVGAVSGKTFPTIRPHDGKTVAQIAEADKIDVNRAVAAARRAFRRNSEWRLMTPSARGRLLHRFADLVERDADYLKTLETTDNGMVHTMTHIMVETAVNILRYTGGLADKIHGTTIPSDFEGLSYTLKQPVGVCGLILPWNAPILMFVNKVATALAAGCTVVVKPAEQTPLTALALVALLAEAGMPRGVVNVVTGYGPTAGAALTHHPHVAKISFTGSLEVGKLVLQAAGATNIKRVTLELGGKSPLVIFDDADLNVALPFATEGVFAHQGQVCMAASRLYVQAGVYDEFVRRAVEVAKNRKVGDPFLTETQSGPQDEERDQNRNLLKSRPGSERSHVATVIEIASKTTRLREQIFGPVQSIMRFETLDEVIDRANDTNYGLAAGVFTSDIQTALQFSNLVEAGTVWVNNYFAFGPHNPFGGFKDSGFGRENGIEGILEYLDTKTVNIAFPQTI